VVVVADLAGRRILVVGASSGIGRAIGLLSATLGADVAFAARRTDRIEQAVAVAGGNSLALACDVRRPEECQQVTDRAAAVLGGLDAVVYAPGLSALSRFEEAGPELWRTLVETNIIGAAMVARAALPHLHASRGRLLFLGSSSVGRPYPGLVPYATTKAALHELARGLRGEYPWLRVTTFIVGPTLTDFADGWDPDLAAAMFARWASEGYEAGAVVDCDEMAAQVVRVLASGANIPDISVMPEVEATADTMPRGSVHSFDPGSVA
jgi:NAD(P)-dependent dehydrogenase (short-subunit alcohol dehydrogenase family)